MVCWMYNSVKSIARRVMPQTLNFHSSNFGDRLAVLRKRKGLTQTQLAEKIGVTRRTIAYYEKESPNLPGNLLLELAKILETSLEELLTGMRAHPTNSKLRGYLEDIERLPQQTQEELMSVVESFLSNLSKE